MLRVPKIRAYIDEQLANEEEDAILSRRAAMKLLTDMAKGSVPDEAVVTVWDKEQNATVPRKVSKVPDVRDRIKAIEMMLKFHEFDGAADELADKGKTPDEVILKALQQRKVDPALEEPEEAKDVADSNP